MNDANLTALVLHEGAMQDANANAPFLLTDPDAVWWIETGGVDVFSIAVRDGAPTGRRDHFCSMTGGQALFGLGPPVGDRALLAVGLPGTRLRRISRTRLRAVGNEPEYAGAVAGLVDAWVEAIAGGVARDVPARIDALIEPGAPHALAVNARFCARRAVLWLPGRTAPLLFLGMEEIEAGASAPWFPVTHAGWLQTLASTQLEGASTAEVIGREEAWAGLALFFATVAACEALNRRLGEVDDLNRQKDRAAAGARATARALEDIAAVLQPGLPPPVTPIEDPLFQACVAVGAAQGLSLHAPPEMQRGEPLTDPLAAIVRASRVRSRMVQLDGRWWAEDLVAPLLAFRKAPRQPVALLPGEGGRCVEFDPATRTATPVDEAVAAAIEPAAHVFYGSFPAVALGAWDLLRFGAQGLRADAWRLVLLGLGGGLLAALPAVATGIIFDRIVPNGARGALWTITLGLLGIAITTAIFEFTRGFALLRIEGRMDLTLQSAVMDRVLKLPARFFRDYAAGDLAQRTLAITEVRRALAHAVVTAGLGNLFAGLSVVVLAVISPALAAVAVALLLVFIVFTGFTVVRQLRSQRTVAGLQGRISGLVLQFITGIAKLRVAGAEDLAFAAWARVFAQQKRAALEGRRLGNRILVANDVFPIITAAVLFWLIAPGRGGAALSVGAFLAFTTAFASVISAVVALTGGIAGALNIIPLLERLQPLLRAAPEDSGTRLDPGTLTGRVELSRVSFRYSPDSPLALDEVSLEIAPGEFVGIVGASGSGKSTLLRLLLGFENTQSGAVHYDGQDFAQLDVMAVRRQMGVVLQTSQTIVGTILTNIIGARALAEEDAWEALRLAGLEADVRDMPMGLHTVIPAGGGVLSGGQRQRLMIARAIVNRPRLLLFDEATSALDNRTQAIVTANLEQLAATRIVIAHRLSTIRRADRIVVMAGGRIVQVGRFGELIERPGPFRDLAARQRLVTESSSAPV